MNGPSQHAIAADSLFDGGVVHRFAVTGAGAITDDFGPVKEEDASHASCCGNDD